MLAVSEQDGNLDSPLEFARHFLRGRRQSAALRLGEIGFVDADAPVLAFTRTHEGEHILCVFNMSRDDVSFAHPLIGAGQVLGLGCGSSMDRGDTVHLGPLAASFRRV
jgi:alpha-glucosidase